MSENTSMFGLRAMPRGMMGMSKGRSAPNVLVKIDKMLNSTVKGYEEYSELIGYNMQLTRADGDTNASGSFDQQGNIIVYPFILTISANNSSYLMLKLGKGDKIEMIDIVHMLKINGSDTEKKRITLMDSFVDNLEEVLAPDGRTLLRLHVSPFSVIGIDYELGADGKSGVKSTYELNVRTHEIKT